MCLDMLFFDLFFPAIGKCKNCFYLLGSTKKQKRNQTNVTNELEFASLCFIPFKLDSLLVRWTGRHESLLPVHAEASSDR